MTKPWVGLNPPTVEKVRQYCTERNNSIDPEAFVDHHLANGWVVGKNKNKMKDWEATVRTWERNEKKYEENRRVNKPKPTGAEIMAKDRERTFGI